MWRVVETDNFGGDYPNEQFATPYVFTKENAERVADVFNALMSGEAEPRLWKVVPYDYQLQPGFEP